MLMTMCGPHGVGKTTVLRSIKVYRPYISVFNSDAVTGPPGAETQLERMRIYERILKITENTDIPVVVDRSPYDFYAYIHVLGIEDEVVSNYLKYLIEEYISLNPITILVKEPFHIIKERIMKRGRSVLEWELDTLRPIYNYFYSESFLCRIETEKAVLNQDDAIKFIGDKIANS